MSVAVFVHATKLVGNKPKDGLLLYPTNVGCFSSSKDREAFANLFEGTPPALPYGGIGKRYGPESFALKEVQNGVLEHMKKNFSLPKNPDTYWAIDGEMHEKLVFHASVVHGKIFPTESNLECAVRTIWEWTGIQADVQELVRFGSVQTDTHESGDKLTDVYHLKTSLDRAKFEWITHQAERLTLTDMEATPYPAVLAEIGVPEIVHSAYCKTQGGPRFIASMEDVKDDFTKRLMEKARVVL